MKKELEKQAKELIDKGEFKTKVKIFFATKSAGEDFDEYEKNYTITNLNPFSINAYSRDLSPNSLIYREFGLTGIGAKELIVLNKYYDWFKTCSKVEIDGEEYVVYKAGAGAKSLLQKRVGGTVRVVLQKV